MTQGHVFVVRGRLEAMDCEAVVIPTDRGFSVRDSWRAAAGLAAPADWPPQRPEHWGSDDVALPARGTTPGGGRGRPRPDVWFADVVVANPADLEQRTRTILAQVFAAYADWGHVRAATDRHVPLVALPVIGVDGGGHDTRRGEAVAAVVRGATRAAADHGQDVVLVAASPADYSALQRAREVLGVPTHLTVGDQHEGDHHHDPLVAAKELGALAAAGELALFLGAGASVGAGLPTWDGLLAALAASPAARAQLRDVPPESMANLGPLERAELLQVALGSSDPEVDSQTVLGHEVAAIIAAARARPSLTHALLASLGVREAATTNYDRLYEEAVTAADGGASKDVHDHVSVLPWDRVVGGRPWVVKMHGDVEHAGSIVLSRSAFVHYDSRWRPIGGLVQGLMLTRHLLVVGASLTDDNLLRLAHEVTHLTTSLQPGVDPARHHREVGTVLTLQPDAAFERVWRDRFEVLAMGDDPRTPISDAARSLAIFLDAVARFAAPTPAHLLDPRYTADHQDERDAARTLRRGAGRARRLADRHAPGWGHVADALEDLGATGDHATHSDPVTTPPPPSAR
ncbi:SIR2 family NAD-dependent protein deacylase [Luteimicrobium subarcticum]|uniref:SIR2-like protein n=1 Tax=Luteimicrobium subarcticum TaxID=620910 RepID=A0A2M8WW36_9MICO|nr:SIR2 family protein [Luteimicrobium subarcticum]PJI95134.1 SIR2-like protein [Luteimicrobium subarcticum]